MSWRESIQTASFRGVPFGVTRATDDLGRRTVRHDFPQRDDPYVEDMGRAARVISVTGFVLGADYMTRRDELQAALDQPGPGILVHPWYGSALVSLTSARMEHSATAGGMSTFTLSFVRVGDAERDERPIARPDPESQARGRADALADRLAALLDAAVRLDGVSSYVADQTRAALMDALDAAGDALGVDLAASASWVTRVADDAAALANMIRAGTLGASLQGLFGALGEGRALTPQHFFAAAASLPAPEVPLEAGITRATAASNAMAVTDAVRNFCATEGLRGAASALPPSRKEAQALRGEVVAAADAVIAGLPLTPAGDEAMSAVTDLRSSVLLALAAHAGAAPDIRVVTLARSLPSLSVVYAQNGSLRAEADLVARNGVEHPGFVPPARRLEVLHA